MFAKAAESSPIMTKLAGSAGGLASAGSTAAESPDEAERRRQILAILEQADRDIAADNGLDWDEVKRRMRDRIAARIR